MKTQFVLTFGFLAAFAHLSTASPLTSFNDRVCRIDMCGGFAGFHCCDGYVCRMPKQEGPIHIADQAGKCEKAEVPVCHRSMCGGIAGLQCCEGFECQMGPIRHPDQAGKCVKKAIINENFAAVCRTDMCGGIAGFQCCAGYHCQMKHEPNMSDEAGKCIKNEIILPVCRTDHCGGIVGFKCCDGYECKMTQTFPDAMGTCQKKA